MQIRTNTMNSKYNYSYSIDECDIQDKAKGEEYRQKRAEWIETLSGEDAHSISAQLYGMLWDYALFLTVNELRRLAAEQPEEGVGFNGPVLRLFDAGFATTQATAIRRLIEKPKKDPKWAVISLRSLLKDIRDNAHLLTRENHVCYDGLPYDFEKLRQEWQSSLVADGKGSHTGTLPTNGPKAWPMSEMVHKNFDRLAQVDSENRERFDQIGVEILDVLEQQLDKCEDVKKYVDKFIAHAATPESRDGLTEDQKALTLERLDSSHKIIYQVTSFIEGSLLWESTPGGLPVPQYDHLVNLDKSWASTTNLEVARKKWGEVEKKISSWHSDSLWPGNFPETK